jgi:hypothetical protein
MQRNIEEILNEAIERLLGGEPLHDILASYPDEAAMLAPALHEAQILLRAGITVPPLTEARVDARERMLADLEASRARAGEFQRTPATAAAVATTGAGAVAARPARPNWFSALIRRPASLRTAAVAGSIALVGVLGIGAAAATGNAPEPVRQFFGASSSALRVEFEGMIVAIEPRARTLEVDVAGDVRTVRVTDTTELSDGGDAIAFEQLVVGDFVEVKGALQIDDTIIASRVHREDGIDDNPDGTPTADQPNDTPTADIDDDNNAGTGNGEHDDGDAEDNSGPGNGESDGDDDGNSGNGEDDDDDDGNSGPGNGSDDDDGNSGPGNGDHDDDDGNAGSGNGDDSGNSGSGGDNNDHRDDDDSDGD